MPKIGMYAAEHYAGRLKPLLDQVYDIMYELRLLDDETFYIDEDEPNLTLYRLEQRANREEDV